MSATDLLLLATAFLGLVLVSFSSGVETGAYALNRARLRVGVAGGDRRSVLLAKLVADLPSLLSAVLIGRAAAHALVSFAVTLLLERALPRNATLVSVLVVAPVVFVAGELAPKELFRRHADGFMAALAPALAVAEAVFSPITVVLGLIPRLLGSLGFREAQEDERSLAAEELRLTIQASTEEGVLTAFQASLARNILSLRHRRVAAALVPLARVKVIDATTPLEHAREVAARAGSAHLLVYRERVEEAVGVVSVYDIFFEDPAGRTVQALTRPAPRFTPNDRVEDALLRLRLAREKLAIVIGPGGGAVGIVTLKDLCEEITGELEDL